MSARAVLVASATAVGPFCLAAAITVVAMAWPASARADTGAGLLSDFGIGPNGAVSSAVGQLAGGFCPLIKKPDGTPAGDPVGSPCATFMASLANGDISALTNAPSIFGTPAPAATTQSNTGAVSSTPTTNPLAEPGI